jgi:nitrogen fixation/metabolism regulation signal transduction histidine kinase
MIAPTRFEKKILAAFAAVAVVPLLGALVLGQGALREAYQVGVNPRVRQELERELAVYRQHFVALRQGADQVADAIGGDWVLRQAIASGDPTEIKRRLDEGLERYPNLARAIVQNASGRTLARSERIDRLDTKTMKLVELKRSMPKLPKETLVLVTVAAPVKAFQDYARAGELVEVYSRLEASGGFVSKGFLAVYLGFLLSVVVIALVVGIAISRGVTRRVAQLARATGKVGSGDLSVEVPSDDRDEIGELTRAFNNMVRDLRESRSRIEYLQRISAWQEFARRLAHEIKNPLTPIQLAMQEVQRSYPGEDERYRKKLSMALSIVEEEIATLRRLVGEFSSFARLPQACLTPADLNEFVRDAARSFEVTDLQPRQESSRGAQAAIKVDLAEQPLPVHIDPMMLKRCLDNLVRNSRQAINSAGVSTEIVPENRAQNARLVPVTVSPNEPVAPLASGDCSLEKGSGAGGVIRIRTRLDGDRALLEVDDNGIGILPQDRNFLFDPYYTTKKEGTGLGLAIVKKVVLEHGGDIECANSDLGGASFRIWLPMNNDVNKEFT